MDELIKTVCDKAGISQDQAKSAVDAVMGFLKSKLPAGISEQLDGVISGKDIGGGLAGMAGTVKDKLDL